MLRTTKAIRLAIPDRQPIGRPLFDDTRLSSLVAQSEDQRCLFIPVELIRMKPALDKPRDLEDFLADSARPLTYSATPVEPGPQRSQFARQAARAAASAQTKDRKKPRANVIHNASSRDDREDD
jgi:hypothetical protein